MRFPRFRDAPLLWKILVPFLVLMLAVGAIGSFAIVRSLASRAQTSIDQELTRRAAEARSALHDAELALLESVGFASNLQGMAEAVERRDGAAVTRLLRSVRALKPDLDLISVVDREEAGTRWRGRASVADVLDVPATTSFLDTVGGRRMLLIASSVCADAPCRPVGAAIAGFDLRRVAEDLGALLGVGVVIYDPRGERVAGSGASTPRVRVPSGLTDDVPLRVRDSIDGDAANTLYASFRLGEHRAGFLAVSIATDPFFASVRGTAWRLGLLLLVAMAGIVAVGMVLARLITAQVSPLVQTNRALGRGDLRARAPVLSSDELGELAAGLNEMADQLEASHETLELRVRQRTDEVQRLLRERTQLFASISHEFRTPLAVIIGQIDMLRDPVWRKQNASRAFETIDEASRQLSSLIEDVLAAARAEGAHLEVELGQVRLPDVVGGVRRTLEGLARGGDHALRVNVPSDLPPVHADAGRLREILLNLVDNSVKYTPAGGTIELSAAERNGHIEISVRDDGPGIPKRAARRVFEPFRRVPGAKTQLGQPSSGLGLALTKRLVEAHGGRIWLESQRGAGSTFTFTLQSVGPDEENR
jgi:signal transduction histidine kinase